MQYEVYADLLFLQYLGMNMILLGCLNRRFSHTATWGRLLSGALVGALCTTVGALPVLPGILSAILSTVGSLGMVMLAFPGALRNALSVFLKETFVSSFYIGGGFLALRRLLQMIGLPRWILCSGMLFAGIGLLLAAPAPDAGETGYHVSLKHRGRTVETIGFVDTGNTLTEPISGKPVAILEPELLERLLGEKEELYRMIPYHSIGRAHGMLKGYCIEELLITTVGGSKRIFQVYLAAAPEGISLPGKHKGEKRGSKGKDGEKIGLLLQPRILQQDSVL